MRLLVTGATGYIGNRLSMLAAASGHKVVTTSRAVGDKSEGAFVFDIDHPHELALPSQIDAVLHLAAITRPDPSEDDVRREVEAARFLFAAATRQAARIVFVSSQTAREDAPTRYGRTKWQIERLALDFGAVVVRPGLVYGGPERGLFGRLARIVRRLPILPDFRPRPVSQPIHVDDLAKALITAAERPEFSGQVVHLGAPRPISFASFLDRLARYRLRRLRLFVPFPRAVLLPMVRGSQLSSLFSLPVMETSTDMARMRLVLRPLETGMSLSGTSKRYLLEEGRAVLGYVLKRPPSPGLVRRYAQCLIANGRVDPLGLPQFMLWWPGSLAAVDLPRSSGSRMHSEASWRLDVAMLIAEASTMGAKRFLGVGEKSGRLSGLVAFVRAGSGETFWRMVGVFVRPLIPLARRHEDVGS